MAQTISELEKERAALLDAIESQAQNMSTKGSDSTEHSLKDWLNAAEEIMPVQKSSRQKTTPQSTPPIAKKDKPNKASFFAVIIVLSLFLTVLGVLYIVYTSINNDLQKALSENIIIKEEVSSLQELVINLDKSVAAGGQGELFEALQAKVVMLEKEVISLKVRQELESVDYEIIPDIAKQVDSRSLVTSEELDLKLNNHTQKINAKLEKIIQHLNIQSVDDAVKRQEEISLIAPKVSQTKTPQIQEPIVRQIDQPVIRLVQKIDSPVKPNLAELKVVVKELPKPIILPPKPPEIKWLMNEPRNHFTLQLSSMPTRAGAQQIKSSKGLLNAKIIPQDRNGRIQYVLVSGSFTDRNSADIAARDFQSEHKISPWVRPFQHLTNRVVTKSP